jgi:transcriptional regulator with XRE-family HTH domain
MKYGEIGPALREYRKSRGLTQAGLAKAAGISRVTLSKAENGQLASLSMGIFLAIVNQLGIEMAFAEASALPTLEELAEEKERT